MFVDEFSSLSIVFGLLFPAISNGRGFFYGWVVNIQLGDFGYLRLRGGEASRPPVVDPGQSCNNLNTAVPIYHLEKLIMNERAMLSYLHSGLRSALAIRGVLIGAFLVSGLLWVNDAVSQVSPSWEIFEDYESRLKVSAEAPQSFIDRRSNGLAEWERRRAITGKPGEPEEFILEIDLWRMPVADGSTISIFINSKEIGVVKLANETGRLVFSSLKGETVPPVKSGDRIEAKYQGQSVLSGVFVED